MSELFTLLWSRQSNGFHIEPLERACNNGMRLFHSNVESGCLLLFMGTRDECLAKAEELRPIREERDVVRRLYSPDQNGA